MGWEKIGFVIASEYRKNILIHLKERPKTPKQLSEEMKIYLSHVSTTLKELTKLKIVECLTPELNKGRLYRLTREGEKIVEELEK